ncbi:hypothetical protein ABPG72_016348, partial [Tetrahymena utriculariae]
MRVQNNETISDITNKNYFSHASLNNDIHHILRKQQNHKFSYIIIHGQLINRIPKVFSQSAQQLNTSQEFKQSSSYSFIYIELFVRKIKYKGVENMSYIEIVKMRQLNPQSHAEKILQEITNKQKKYIYSQMFENPSEFQNIISDLELNCKFQDFAQFNMFHSEFQQNCSNHNQNQQQLLIKETDNQINFTQTDIQQAQQLILKQQTLGDESSNLEQIKIMLNRIEYYDLNYFSDESSKQLQNVNSSEQKFNQLIQENQISNQDQQIKIASANNNSNFQNLSEVLLSGGNVCEQQSLQKSNYSLCINIIRVNKLFAFSKIY